MTRRFFFFATKKDLHKIIQNVEKSMNLKYVENTAYDSCDMNVYNSLEEYEYLGTKQSGECQSEMFIVLERDTELRLNRVPQCGGGVKYFPTLDTNNDSIYIFPGGIYEDKYWLSGHIVTGNESPNAIKIFNLFKKYIKKQCPNCVGLYWYSDEVKNLSNNYRLITINTKQPTEYDLKV